MEENLKVKMTGDASGLEQASANAAAALGDIGAAGNKLGVTLSKTLGELTSQLKRFQSGIKDAGNTESFARIQRAIDATKDRINALNNITSFQGLRKGSDQASQSLLNLSRVAQDAPYGFIGIANNLNPLLESFQRLQKETGSTKASLSALVSSLGGAGGLGLALGVGSSLLVAFGDKLFDSGNSAERTKEKVDELTKSIQYLNDEAARIGDLFGSTATIEVAKLKAAGEDEQKIYEAQNKALLEKRELLRNTGLQISGKSGHIQNQPEFNLDEFNSLLESGGKMEGINSQFDAVRREQLKNEADYYKNEEEIQLLGLQNQQRIREDDLKNQKEAAAKAKAARLKEIEETKKYLEERRQVFEDYAKLFQSVQIPFPDIEFPKDNKKLADKLQRELAKQALIKEFKVQVDQIEVVSNKDVKFPLPTPQANTSDKSVEKHYNEFKDIGKELGDRVGTGFGEVFEKKFGEAFDAAMKKGLSDKELEQFLANIEIAGAIAAKGLAGVADSVGALTDALFEGKNAGQAFGEALKNVFKSLAKEILKDIVLAAILSAISGGSTSFVSALGGLLSGASPKGFSKGGIVPGTGNSDTVPAMLTPGEMVIPKDRVKDVQKILANSVSLKLPNLTTLSSGLKDMQSIRRLSPERVAPLSSISSSINPNTMDFPSYLPQHEISGDTLRLWYARAKKSGDRYGA